MLLRSSGGKKEESGQEVSILFSVNHNVESDEVKVNMQRSRVGRQVCHSFLGGSFLSVFACEVPSGVLWASLDNGSFFLPIFPPSHLSPFPPSPSVVFCFASQAEGIIFG